MATFGSVDVAVRFLADATSVKNEAGKLDGIGSKLKGWAVGVGGAIGGAFAIDKVMDFVGAAEESEVATARLQETLGLAGDTTGEFARHAEDLATKLMNQTGIDDEVIKGGQAILATFHDVSGAAGQSSGAFDRATQAALDMSKTGFGDVNSAATMLGKALQDPEKGLTALGRVGITFSEDQKKAIKAMVESGDKAGAMSAILDNVEGQVGGVAKETATAGDKMRVSFGETKEAIGKMLLPAFQAIVPYIRDAAQWIQDHLIPALSDFFAWISDHREEIGSYFAPFVDAIKTVVPIIVDLATTIATNLQPVFTWLGDWISEHKDIFPAIAIAITTMLVPAFVAWAISAASAAAATIIAAAPFILLGAAITAFAYLIISNWDTIVAVTQATWSAITGAISAAVDWIVGAFQWVVDKAAAVFGWIKDNWPLLLAILTGPFGIAVKLIIDNWDSILDFFKSLPGKIGGFLSGLGAIIAAPFQWAWDQIVTIKDNIASAFGTAIDGIKNIWNTFARGWNAVEADVPSVHIPWPIDKDVGGFTFGLPDLPTFAQGGLVTRPTLAIVGEAGPEMIVPVDQLAQARTAPAVVIEEANFYDQADIDVFLQRAAWQVRTAAV